MKKLIVGLGNFGNTYRNNRHNVGFLVLGNFFINSTFISNKSLKCDISEGEINGNNFILCKPNTYMNLSGESVNLVQKFYKISNKDTYVIYDDIETKAGNFKITFAGGAGGHNGIRSIDSICGKDYNRIKIGVGRPVDERISISSYVLSDFTESELDLILKAGDLALNSVKFD